MRRIGILLIIIMMATAITLALGSALTGKDKEADEAYINEINEWHKGRVDRLRSNEGYLSLVGLFPLPEGGTTFGSSDEAGMVFPKKAPSIAGTIHNNAGVLTIEAASGAEITSEDKPVTNMQLLSDHDEGGPTMLTMGSIRFYAVVRGGSPYLRVKDNENDLLRKFDFAALDSHRYPIDRKWRIEARFEPYEPPKVLELANQLGYIEKVDCPGAAVFELGGKTYRLEPTVMADQLFFVFGDATSGDETYGGGRFLYAHYADENGVVVLDFNKSYTPPCAFSAYTTCTLPHEANIIEVKVEAGEKMIALKH